MVAVGDHGLDFAWSKPSISAIKADNNKFVMRYLSWATNGKNLTKSEYDSYLNNGIAVGLNWEYAGGDQRRGAAGGSVDGAEAYRQARALNAPQGAAIYFSNDWDVQDSELPTVRAYWSTAQSALRGYYTMGVYAGYRGVSAALDRGYYGWQTYAWSYGHWDSRASIRQVLNEVTVGGADVDRNVLMSTNNGLILPNGTVGGIDVNLTDRLNNGKTVEDCLTAAYTAMLRTAPFSGGISPVADQIADAVVAKLGALPAGSIDQAMVVAAVKEALKEGTG